MKQLAKWYEWVLLLPVVLPLFFVQGMMYPLLAPKTFALRTLGILALSLFVFLVLRGQPFFWDRLRHPLTWIPGALLVLAYLTSLIGVDFYHSFWSTFERGDGLLTLSVCVGYFYLVLLSAEKPWLSHLLRYAAWVGSGAAVYLVVQWLVTISGGTIPFIVKANGRIGGTMGNAAFLAAYLGMTFFATLAVATEYRLRWRRILMAGAALQFFAIVLTATRGTMLALLGVAGTALLYGAFATHPYRTAARKMLALLIVGCTLFLLFRAPLSTAPFEPIRRLASISLSDATVASRLFVWRTVSEEALKRPLHGYGAEHIDVPFDQVYDPSIISEEWFDRSHNAYLDYAVQYGIGGLLLYLGLIAAFIYMSVQLVRGQSRYGPFLLGIAGTIAIQNFFVFDTAMTLWLFLMLFAGMAIHNVSDDSRTRTVLFSPRPVIGVLAGIAILTLVVPVVIQPLRANLLAFEAYQYQIVDVARTASTTERGVGLATYADLEFGYNAYFMYTREQVRRLSGADLRTAYVYTVALLNHNFEKYPYDARTAMYLAQVISLAPPDVTPDTELLSSALERILRLSPKRSQAWYILANLALDRANAYPAKSKERLAGYAAAQDILARYVALVPHLSQPHFVLAQLLFASGDTVAAAEEAEKGRETYREDLDTAKRAVVYYETVFDLPNAAFFLSEIVRLDPSNEAARSDLETIRAHEQSQ
ncbi:MAG: O-antigen ligase family protein [Patescibacteria group bacterium]